MSEDSLWNRLELSAVMQQASENLRQSRVLLVGVGGLGSEIALRLAGARIGHLTLVDGDQVSLVNVPHSSVFLPKHVGRKKADVVSAFLRTKFPGIHVTPRGKYIQQYNQKIARGYDFLVCAPDNNITRIHLNTLAVAYQKPALFIGLGGPSAEWTGYTFLYTPGVSGCFACFFSGGEAPKSSATSEVVADTEESEENRRRCCGENIPAPMLAPVVGTVASYAATVVVKSLIGTTPGHAYTYLDLRQPRLMTLPIKPAGTCFVCGNPPEYELSA